MFDFRRTDHEEMSILSLQGHLNALNAEQLRSVINDMVLSKRKFIVIDLSSLELIDSSGVGALVSLFKRIQNIDGRLKIAGLNGQPRDIFHLLNLHKAFDMAADTEDAVRSFLDTMHPKGRTPNVLKRMGVLSK